MTQIMDLVHSRCLLNIFQINELKPLPTGVPPRARAWMDGIWNFQETTSDLFSIIAQVKIWRERTISVIGETGDGCKAQISEGFHDILKFLSVSCWIWSAVEIWKLNAKGHFRWRHCDGHGDAPPRSPFNEGLVVPAAGDRGRGQGTTFKRMIAIEDMT